jgi:hypothetical protein
MTDADKLAAMLIGYGQPHNDKSTPMRALKIANSNTFNGKLGEVLDEVVGIACTHKSPTYLAPYRANAKLIITNLIAAAFQAEWLGLGTRIVKDSYLAKMGLDRRRVEKIVDALIQGETNKFCTPGRGGYKHHGNEKKSRSSQYYPSDLLIRCGTEMLYETVGDFDDYEPYVYKGDHKWDVNEATSTQVLKEYNEFMRDHTWAFKAPTVRILGEASLTGGRVYTPYQNIVNRHVKVRTQTLLDAEPLIECDFSSNHPYMLARLCGVTLAPNFYESIADAARVSRAQVKLVVTRSIGCKNKKGKAEMTYGLLAEQMDTEMVESILNETYKLHPWTQDNNVFFSGKGNYMQWLEGEIAIKMFASAASEGIPMINIHDAYAVNQPYTSRTQKLMNQYREEVLEAYKPVLAVCEI